MINVLWLSLCDKCIMTEFWGFFWCKLGLLHYGDLNRPVLLPQWVPYTQGSVKITFLYQPVLEVSFWPCWVYKLSCWWSAQPESCWSKEQLSSAVSASRAVLSTAATISCASEIQGVRQHRVCALTGSTAAKCWTQVEFCGSLSSFGPCPAELR